MNTVSSVYDHLLPSAEELWSRTPHKLVSVPIDIDHSENIPFFDLSIDSFKELKHEALYTPQRKIGYAVTSRVILNDGIDRAVRALVLDDDYRRDDDVTVTDGTAWFTTIDGYAGKRARAIAQLTHSNVIQIGSEHSAKILHSGLDVLRLTDTLRTMRTSSLAKTAQSEQLIIAEMTKRYGLSARQYAIGDSRGSMKVPGQIPYAQYYKHAIDYFDIKAPCIPERLGLRELPSVAHWFGQIAVQGSGVVARLVLEGDGKQLLSTGSLNPNFIASSIGGVMPTLASGEAGVMTSWVPRNQHGQVTLYNNDSMSRPESWEQLWGNHPNVSLRRHDRKGHLHLLENKAHKSQIERIRSFGAGVVRAAAS